MSAYCEDKVGEWAAHPENIEEISWEDVIDHHEEDDGAKLTLVRYTVWVWEPQQPMES